MENQTYISFYHKHCFHICKIGGVGRTSTMSPVSTLSTLSSISSASSVASSTSNASNMSGQARQVNHRPGSTLPIPAHSPTQNGGPSYSHIDKRSCPENSMTHQLGKYIDFSQLMFFPFAYHQ